MADRLPMVQLDPLTGRIACPLCPEVVAISITVAPWLKRVPGTRQLGLSIEVAGSDSSALWDHVKTVHAEQYRRDVPDGARRGMHHLRALRSQQGAGS